MAHAGSRRLTVATLVLVLIGAVVPMGRASAIGEGDATPYPGGTWAPPPATYGVYAVRNVPVLMSDGVYLVVDVYYPADPVTGLRVKRDFPVLLAQTPYSGSLGAADLTSQTGPGEYYVRRGYVYVAADVRGTGRSTGAGGFFSPRDAQDGAELVSWAAGLEGVNGVVGLHGCSYLGLTQLYTGGMLPMGTPVKAMIPACTASDPYRTIYMVNGIPAPAWEGAGLLAGALLGPTIEAYMVPKYLDSQIGGDTAYYKRFWQDRDTILTAPAIAQAGIATLLWNGWDDSGFGGLELYAALQNAHFGRPLFAPLTPDTAVTGRYQLLLGDWAHGGGLDEGVQLQWYETWLKGEDTGLAVDTTTPLHVQERGSGRWSNLAAYPFTTSYTPLYLHADGALAAAPVAAQTRELRWAPSEVDGATLTYETSPFADGATLAGPAALRVRASSTTTDLQLMTDLYDVAPDGTAVHVAHGGTLGSMRSLQQDRSWSDSEGRFIRPYLALGEEVPLTPGDVVTLDIPLQPTLWQLAPGHRVRLRLAGQIEASTCLQKAAAVTTGAFGCRARSGVQARLAGARFNVHHDAQAFLNLPILPLDFLPAAPSGTTPTGDSELPLEW